jgi:hypothetical protein
MLTKEDVEKGGNTVYSIRHLIVKRKRAKLE